MQIGHDNPAHSLRRTAVWPVLASLLGLLLTHGVAIACLAYCVLIDPPQPMLMYHHQHTLAIPTATDRAAFVPAMPGSPVLEQGDQVPLALPVALLALVALAVVRWFRSQPTMRFASWIVPQPAPPPRLSTAH